MFSLIVAFVTSLSHADPSQIHVPLKFIPSGKIKQLIKASFSIKSDVFTPLSVYVSDVFP